MLKTIKYFTHLPQWFHFWKSILRVHCKFRGKKTQLHLLIKSFIFTIYNYEKLEITSIP